MKKADYMIVGIALMLALVSFGVYRLYFASTGRAAIVEITVDGNVYKTLSLKEDATVVVPSDGGHTNTVQINPGILSQIQFVPDCLHMVTDQLPSLSIVGFFPYPFIDLGIC